MEILARIVYDTTQKSFVTIVKHEDTSQTSFNTVDTDQNVRCLLVGLCSATYAYFQSEGYDMTKLETYMNNEGIPIPE